MFFAMLLLAGCSSMRHYTSQESQRDTVITERIVHDTAFVEIPLEREITVVHDSSSHLENRFAKSDACIDSLGRLHHSLETIPQKMPIPVVTTVTDTKIISGMTRTMEIPVRQEPKWWQKVLMYLGALSVLYVIIKMSILIKRM